MKKVTTHEAKTHLSRLVAEVEKGEEIIILRGSRPVARLTAARRTASAKRPKVGTHTSAPVQTTRDAFAPLTEAELSDWTGP